jgi:hypothetical protein
MPHREHEYYNHNYDSATLPFDRMLDAGIDYEEVLEVRRRMSMTFDDDRDDRDERDWNAKPPRQPIVITSKRAHGGRGRWWWVPDLIVWAMFTGVVVGVWWLSR